jgi:hypothetical protein
MMVSMGALGSAFNLMVLGCANLDAADVRLTVESIPGDDGELDSAVSINVVTTDQTSATAMASLLGLEATTPCSWSGMVTPTGAGLPVRCTVTPWRAVRTVPSVEAGSGPRPFGNRAAS